MSLIAHPIGRGVFVTTFLIKYENKDKILKNKREDLQNLRDAKILW